MKLLNFLLTIYKEEYDLNLKEGLIKTTNIGKTLSILQKSFDYGFEYINLRKENTFLVVFHNVDEIQLDRFLKYIDNLGWFPSWLSTSKYAGKWNKKLFNGNRSEITFEAKFDKQIVEKIPSILYHITPTQNSDKILKIGLVPKSRSKASYHPERVYLGKSMEGIEDLAPLMYQKTGNKNFTLLKINTETIPGDYLKLYTDPNYSKEAYYTLNNIPPQSIEIVKNIEL
jgi:hypothetical protein